MMDGDMFGNTMWAGHWLWMLVIQSGSATHIKGKSEWTLKRLGS